MPKAVGPSTMKKNIERESNRYFVRHKTHRFIQKLAELDQRPVGSYLDVLLEREARKLLPADQVETIIAEGEAKEIERRAQAEQMLAEQKLREQRTKAAS